ncbi:hypothetical protein NPIL_382511 [Nephila pilipes]|uniref:Uncharacterized protein n=1 Tax=Nephila pilipes TaxID=299642 RepID=A0A8X6MZ60_NEPPI|nr:hypothetical protein NPIL_382511 [Nephila pilipes]
MLQRLFLKRIFGSVGLPFRRRRPAAAPRRLPAPAHGTASQRKWHSKRCKDTPNSSRQPRSVASKNTGRYHERTNGEGESAFCYNSTAVGNFKAKHASPAAAWAPRKAACAYREVPWKLI